MNKNEPYIYRIRRNAIRNWKRLVQQNSMIRELSPEEFYKEMQTERQQIIKTIEAGAICSPSIEVEGKPGKANYFIINDIGEGTVCEKCGHTGAVVLLMDKKRLKKLDMKVYRPSFETYYNLGIDPSDSGLESMFPIPVNYKKDFWYCPYCNELHRFSSKDNIHVEYDQRIIGDYKNQNHIGEERTESFESDDPFERDQFIYDCIKIINELDSGLANSVKSQDKSQVKPTEDQIEQARISGEPVLIAKWLEPCNDPTEECSWDYIRRYVYPNGELKDDRQHTY